MSKTQHEVRDPIHIFIHFTAGEREVINSRPFQRLRHIHQLAMSYLVYPGATHKRFEHSLGVMELATRVYDVITDHSNLSQAISDQIPELTDPTLHLYWRQALRM
ncbi:MAG TPA: HD domain-containing protein, partial [Armatimonadota bacterium]|nr:HD domain-containing protein [Armatimonadota bacterium]